MRKDRNAYTVRAVVNALRLLEALADDEAGSGVTDLSRSLGLPKNNVFRLLATLEVNGYAERSPVSGNYRIGARALSLGDSVRGLRRLPEFARPVLEDLASALGETAHLAVGLGSEVLAIEAREPDRSVRAATRIGKPRPAHSTALGKVCLAFSPEPSPLHPEIPARTPRTIVDPDKFREHLRAVVSEGFALDREETETGVVCAAAPVFDAAGQVVAALSVTAPAFRFDEHGLLQRAVPGVVLAAESLSAQLGHGGVRPGIEEPPLLA